MLSAAPRPWLLSVLLLEVWLSSFLPRALAAEAPSRERLAVP